MVARGLHVVDISISLSVDSDLRWMRRARLRKQKDIPQPTLDNNVSNHTEEELRLALETLPGDCRQHTHTVARSHFD